MAQSFSVQPDQHGFYQLQKNANSQTSAARKAQTVTVSIANDSRRSGDAAVLSVSLGPEINLNNGSNFTLIVRTSPELTNQSDVIYISNKLVDRSSRTMQIPVGGLNANTDYYFTLLYSSECTGETIAEVHYKTGAALQKPKRILLILDKQYENDLQIEQALSVYKADVNRADPNLVFERFYLSTDPAEKGKLYEQIKSWYFDATTPLHYLFFIGQNASTYIRSYHLNPKTNQAGPGDVFSLPSIGVYAKILTQDYPFDPQQNAFINRRYRCQDVGADPIPNDISSTYAQSSIVDISYGAIVPTRPEEGKAYLLRYFEKLHRYKTGQIKFDKKALLADTFYHDGSYPKKVEELTGRWTNNDTINVPRKYGPNFHGDDPIWRADYLKKLGSNSYEIATFYGHGSPGLHYFGITPTEIQNLGKLNTLLFDFLACSVGGIDVRDYMAGTYLDKGNTLFVNAYSVTIFASTQENESPLLEKFKEKRPFHAFARGAYVSDAFRHGFTFNDAQYPLGDPLLLLDPPCTNAEPLVISAAGSLSLCSGDTVSLRVPETFTDFRWFRNGQEITTAKSQKLVVSQSGSYTAKAKQCGQEVSSEGITITEKPGPVIPVLTVETFPDRYRLRVTPAGAFTGGFSWFINGERWQETTQDTARPVLLADYSVRVVKDGCSALSKPVSVRIEKPALSVTAPVPLCTGDSVALKAPDNFSSYTWLTKDGPSVTTTSSTRFIKQSASVAVTPKRGNLEGPTSDYVTMNFSPKPTKPTLTLESNGFRSSSTTGNQWYRNGQPLPDSTRQVLRNPGAGTYTVRVTGQGGCFNDSDPMIITAVEPTPGTLKVYPNPGNGTFWVEWPDAFRSGDLEVVDNLGRQVYSRSYASKPVGPVPVRLKTAPGLYLLRLSNAGQIHTVKVVIETD
ncbi:T9SS type A sorting domain-containing protein [Larkinella humicola]|uniref:T9SS type A sorting domain-containing protein n=1 Tax=Larkinella humicola TaxID=2607654 RepID=UPI001784456C|nr:T9SS type A sorting domain-containing protein [Larkinella humicola]